MTQQTYQATTPQIADRGNPPAPKIQAAFASFSTAVSADRAYAHSTVALIVLPAEVNRR